MPRVRREVTQEAAPTPPPHTEETDRICFECGAWGDLGWDIHPYNLVCPCGSCHEATERFICKKCADKIVTCIACGRKAYITDCTKETTVPACAGDYDPDDPDCAPPQSQTSAQQAVVGYVCVQCRNPQQQEERSIIGNYNSSMRYTPFKKPFEKYAMGIELEVELKSNVRPNSMANRVLAYLKRHGFEKLMLFKEDGTLTNGYEIVSQPFSRSAMRSEFWWYKFLTYLSKTGHTSYESGHCGLHIHVSKVFDDRTCEHIGRVAYALRELLGQFSFRKGYYDYCMFDPIMYSTANTGKYYAMRMKTGKETIEFRFARGTLNHRRFIATVQCIDVLIQFALSIPRSALRLSNTQITQRFIDYVKRAGYAQLFYSYIKKLYGGKSVKCACFEKNVHDDIKKMLVERDIRCV